MSEKTELLQQNDDSQVNTGLSTLRRDVVQDRGQGTEPESQKTASKRTKKAAPGETGKVRGRKPKSLTASTMVIRIPPQYKTAVEALIAHLDAGAQLTSFHSDFTSEPLFLRSLYDRPQHLTFTIKTTKK